MKFRKLLGILAEWHAKGQTIFNSGSVSRQLNISRDHAYRDLWRLWRMSFLNRKKVKRKHYYRINKKGWRYLKYLHAYEPNFHISSLEACNKIRIMVLQQRGIFSDVSDNLKTFSLLVPDGFESYGLMEYFRNKKTREKFNEINEKILEELDFIGKVSSYYANEQSRKNTKRHS